MARVTMPITPVHTDGTPCTHQVNQRTGHPKDPTSDCTGRTGYAATCSACDRGHQAPAPALQLTTRRTTDMTVPTGFTTLYGLTIATCDEDAEAFLALGHHDPRRMTAAANRLLRTERVERYRPMVGELPRITHTFGTLTGQPVDEDGEGGWSFEFANPDEASAQAVTLLEVPGLGDFELLAVSSRCPDCSRLTTTGHYMSARMRALSTPSPLGHECRICGAIWPAASRAIGLDRADGRVPA